jgi:hypothetical protein
MTGISGRNLQIATGLALAMTRKRFKGAIAIVAPRDGFIGSEGLIRRNHQKRSL